MKDLSVKEVFELHQAGEHPYLDVRTPEEFVQGHASGAVNIPVMVKAGFGMAPNPSFVDEVKKTFTDPSQTIIVGCKSGKRSAAACGLLGDAYSNLINNASGFDGWIASGYPVHK